MAVEAVQHVRRMRGGAQAHLMRADDGHFYVVKFQNNPQHLRVLANELLATRLAENVGPASTGNRDRCSERMADEKYAGATCDQSGLSSRCKPGLQFGARYVCDPAEGQVFDYIPESMMPKVKNLAALPACWWRTSGWETPTADRRCSGRKPTERKYTATFIDQGYCFNAGEWNFPDVALRGVYARNFVYQEVTRLGVIRTVALPGRESCSGCHSGNRRHSPAGVGRQRLGRDGDTGGEHRGTQKQGAGADHGISRFGAPAIPCLGYGRAETRSAIKSNVVKAKRDWRCKMMLSKTQCRFFVLRYAPDAVKNELSTSGWCCCRPPAARRCGLPAIGRACSALILKLTWKCCKRWKAICAKLREMNGDHDLILRRIQDSFSNAIQPSEFQACLAVRPRRG